MNIFRFRWRIPWVMSDCKYPFLILPRKTNNLAKAFLAIDLTKTFDMVDQTKLASALSLFPLSRNTERCLSACLKSHTASCRYNFTLSFHARIVVSPEGFYIPYLFNFFAFAILQSDNLLPNSYADDFTVACSNSNFVEMAEAYRPCSNYWVDGWASLSHFCSKVHHHSFHPSIPILKSLLTTLLPL